MLCSEYWVNGFPLKIWVNNYSIFEYLWLSNFFTSNFLYECFISQLEDSYIVYTLFPLNTALNCMFTLSGAQPLIWKIGLDRATRVWDEPVLKPIDGHFGKITRSSVFVSKSYFEASEIGLECSQYVLFDNFKRNYY